jgi:hypothetical protein
VPVIEHHTNNYGGEQGDEWNLNERVNGGLTQIHVGLTRRFLYGPFKGRFGKGTFAGHDTALFYSFDAHFANWNSPDLIIINNFPYQVQFRQPSLISDTSLLAAATTGHEGGFPSSLAADTTDTVTFYYYKNSSNVSDTVGAWSVDSTGTYFTGPYADSLGDTLFFGKSYQPTQITLYDGTTRLPINYKCHWDHNTGKILLTDTMSPLASHTGYGFSYVCDEGPDYPVQAINVDSTDYNYHTYAVELLPHEARFLVDGAVRQRFPDRLVPKGSQQYDYVTKFPRTPMSIEPAEIDMDGDPNDTSAGSVYYMEKAYFDANHTTCLGCLPLTIGGQPSPHHLVDYVKVWDLPSGSKLPDFPH